ncbi:hypothetical protein ACJJTC_012941 [Scirpophaga incertulas]
MRRLSPEVQRILTAQRDLSLEKVAEIADAIAETPSTAPQAVYTAQSSSSLSELDCIKQAVLELTRKVSIDRVKPAYFSNDSNISKAPVSPTAALPAAPTVIPTKLAPVNQHPTKHVLVEK